ncbi:hypothetical protein C7N43_31695 [Sphingobacteriales bacterium UPWRP_1]|nr:hypothetical protein BVG80_01520 [Sphingobacteriales bacterium TSM_CSM]PSJ72930.1 hypothetical protein C7N43_31695 [Sphingobacteriales bacterium UPWRP_1]
MNGAKIPSKNIGAAISALDQNLGASYIKNRKIATAGLGIWVTGILCNSISLASVKTDAYGNVSRSSSAQTIGTIGSIISLPGLVTFIVGTVKRNKTFRDFNVLRAAKYSGLDSGPSFHLAPSFSIGDTNTPASGGMKLTVGF